MNLRIAQYRPAARKLLFMKKHESHPRYTTDIVVIDLEASSDRDSGIQIEKSNIIEIGAVRLDRKSLQPKSTFSEFVKPRDYPIDPFITEITGITPQMVERCDGFAKVAGRFIEWYGPRNRAILAAYGAYYDIPLLRKECTAFGIPFNRYFVGGALDVRTVGLLWLAQKGEATDGITIENILEKMGLSHLELGYHRALDDARGAAAILQYYHTGEVFV